MTTSHLCDGKWKPGPVAECPKHTRLSKKQTSVFRTPDKAPKDGANSSDSGKSKNSGSSSSGSSSSD